MYRFDVDALLGLSTFLRNTSADLEEALGEINVVLGAAGRRSPSVGALAEDVSQLEMRAADLAERARFVSLSFFDPWALAQADREILLELWNEVDGDPDHRRRYAPVSLEFAGRQAGFLSHLASLRPPEVAALTAGLPLMFGRRMATRFPAEVASVDGLPFAWRAHATRQLMGAERERLLRESDRWMRVLGDWLAFPQESERDRMAERIALLDAWLESERTFIWFSPQGDGELVEVIGDLEAADAVGVFVPGIGSELETFANVADHAGGFFAASQDAGVNVAMVAWLGYDAPRGWGLNADAVSSDNAEEGFPSLVSFVDGLAAQRPDVPVTVVGHSYGSVLVGWAATSGHLNAERVILVGSPNVPGDESSAFNLPFEDSVFVGEAPGDPVVTIGNLTDGWKVEGRTLGHGYDPGDCDWGAHVFEVQDVGVFRSHSTYSQGISADAVIQIMTSDTAGVTDLCG